MKILYPYSTQKILKKNKAKYQKKGCLETFSVQYPKFREENSLENGRFDEDT